MKNELFEVIFHTMGMEKELSGYDKLKEEDKTRLQKMYELLDGRKGRLSRSSNDCNYYLSSVQDRALLKEFCWLLEQDHEFGRYIADRDQFDRDWDECRYMSNHKIRIFEDYFEISK